MSDDISDYVYRIEPDLEGFKAIWGFDPTVKSQKPIHEWVIDEIEEPKDA